MDDLLRIHKTHLASLDNIGETSDMDVYEKATRILEQQMYGGITTRDIRNGKFVMVFYATKILN